MIGYIYFDEWVNILMNGSIFSMARYMIGVCFRNFGHTPVPQLPLSYPPEACSSYGGYYNPEDQFSRVAAHMYSTSQVDFCFPT